MPYSSIVLFCVCSAFLSVLANEVRPYYSRIVRPNPTEHKFDQQESYVPESIPLELYKELTLISTEDDFERKFLQPVSGLLPKMATNEKEKTQTPTVEKKQPNHPEVAGCEPEVKTICLQSTQNDPTILYMPSCVKVKRCGGCCLSDLLVCQPTVFEFQNISVRVVQYMSDGTFNNTHLKQNITVESHTKCTCDCKTKAKHCNAQQEYDKKSCKCVCKNTNEKNKCENDKKKIWNFSRCLCDCRNVTECSTGYSFDNTTCSCIESSNHHLQHHHHHHHRNEYEIV